MCWEQCLQSFFQFSKSGESNLPTVLPNVHSIPNFGLSVTKGILKKCSSNPQVNKAGLPLDNGSGRKNSLQPVGHNVVDINKYLRDTTKRNVSKTY